MATRKAKQKKHSQVISVPSEKKPAGAHPRKKHPGGSLFPGSVLEHTVVFILLVIATAVLYAPALGLGFFRIDDQQYVVNNPWIQGFTADNLRYIFTTPYFVNFSPLHLLSYMIDFGFNGADPYVFHLSSNIWAGIVAGLVYLTSLALTQKKMLSIAAAILFVVHPAHVEAVAWISSRKDLVAAA
ncbi:MAG TPA: hypothetical protein VFZ78_03910, partial [Flavisolibacter sp.]